MFELYQYNSGTAPNKLSLADNYKLGVRRLSIFNWIYSKHPIYDLYWFLNTLGKCWVFTVSDGNEEVHYSYVTRQCLKFHFMQKNDLQIGNCFTREKYRGQGIYPYVIQNIIEYFHGDINDVFMLIENHNTASQRGVKKLGFKKIASVYTKKILFLFKIYMLNK